MKTQDPARTLFDDFLKSVATIKSDDDLRMIGTKAIDRYHGKHELLGCIKDEVESAIRLIESKTEPAEIRKIDLPTLWWKLALLISRCQVFEIDGKNKSENSQTTLINEHKYCAIENSKTHEARVHEVLGKGFFEVLEPLRKSKIRISKNIGVGLYCHSDDSNVILIMDSRNYQSDVTGYTFYNISKNIIISDVKSMQNDLQNRYAIDLYMRFRAGISAFYKSLDKILSNTESAIEKPSLIFNSIPHFGHYIMNVLSQYERFDDFEVTANIRKMFVGKSFGFLQDHQEEKLFSDNFRELMDRGEIPAALADCYTYNSFLIHVGGRGITNRFSQKIKQRLLSSNVDNSLRMNCGLVIGVGLRCGSRELVNQVDVYTQLIKKLSMKYNSIGIIIDGMFRSDVNGLSTHKLLSEEDEVIAATTLERNLLNLDLCKGNVVNLVGLSLIEQLQYLNQVNLVLAPLGSGYAKYLWMLGKTGIAFGPRSVVKSYMANEGGSVVSLNFNNALLDQQLAGQHCISHNHIQDVANDLGPYRYNFTIELDNLYSEVCKIIPSTLSR